MSKYQGFYNGVPLTFTQGSGSGSGPVPCVDNCIDSRPIDWLQMPVPEDDEIYMLMHIPNRASSLLAFVVTAAEQYTVEIGTVENGEFVSTGTKTTRNSGEKYETELLAKDFTSITSTNMKQAMVKVSGTSIYTFATAQHSNRTGYYMFPIVEIRCRLPNGTQFKMANVTMVYVLHSLRYFSWEGPNNLTNASEMFYNMYGLHAVFELDTSKVTNMSSMFRNCFSLLSLCDMDFSQVEDASHMFNNCYALYKYPNMESMRPINAASMFKFNIAADVMPKVDFSRATNLEETFSANARMTYIPTINVAVATNMSKTFNTAAALQAVTFDPDVTDWAGCDIDLSPCCMGHDALYALITSLPKITTTKTLNISNNYGTRYLSSDVKQIAADKNWQLKT